MMYTQDINFLNAVNIVLTHEGGYVNNPDDPGGETNFGICKKDYPLLNIKTLTIQGAKVIYYNDFWMKNNYNQIKNSTLAAKMLDLAVDIGSFEVNKILQHLVNVKEDGVMGPITISAINSYTLKFNDLYENLIKDVESYYDHLIQTNPSLEEFRKGWMNRLHG